MARFKKGVCPNPTGRPPGTKNAANRLRLEMVTETELAAIVAKVVAMAVAGDLTAAALVLQRTIPVLKPRIADVEEEVGLAEAIQAARLRAMAGSGFRISLETLVTESLATELVINTGVVGGLEGGIDIPAPATAALTPPESAPTSKPLAPAPRLDLRDDYASDGGYATGDYNPLD